MADLSYQRMLSHALHDLYQASHEGFGVEELAELVDMHFPGVFKREHIEALWDGQLPDDICANLFPVLYSVLLWARIIVPVSNHSPMEIFGAIREVRDKDFTHFGIGGKPAGGSVSRRPPGGAEPPQNFEEKIPIEPAAPPPPSQSSAVPVPRPQPRQRTGKMADAIVGSNNEEKKNKVNLDEVMNRYEAPNLQNQLPLDELGKKDGVPMVSRTRIPRKRQENWLELARGLPPPRP